MSQSLPKLTTPETRRENAKGRPRYLLFAITIEDPEIIQEIQAYQNHLEQFECTKCIPEDNLHITLKRVGYIVETPSSPNEHSPKDVLEIAYQAQDIFEEVEPFEIQLSDVETFPKALYASIEESNELTQLHNKLGSEIDKLDMYEFESDDFIPHLTLAQYDSRDEFNALIDVLDEFPKPKSSITVDSISLIAADMTQVFPQERCLYKYELNG